jgi:hypothetical protein
VFDFERQIRLFLSIPSSNSRKVKRLKGKLLAGLPERPESTRVEQIPHDIAVIETAIYLSKTKGIAFKDITTEKQLHQQDGFGVRRHRPDFIYTKLSNNQDSRIQRD